MKSISNTIENTQDIKDTTYQVWVLGYDDNGDITDFEVLVNEYKDAERMVEYAKKYVKEECYKTIVLPNEIKYIEILGETVTNFEGYTENIETLFSKIVKVK